MVTDSYLVVNGREALLEAAGGEGWGCNGGGGGGCGGVLRHQRSEVALLVTDTSLVTDINGYQRIVTL